jgi:hypothetical protein
MEFTTSRKKIDSIILFMNRIGRSKNKSIKGNPTTNFKNDAIFEKNAESEIEKQLKKEVG